MDTVIALLLGTGFVTWLGITLERTHRRTSGLGRAPFGADLEGDRDILRTLADLDAARARQHGETPTSEASTGATAAPPAEAKRSGRRTAYRMP